MSEADLNRELQEVKNQLEKVNAKAEKYKRALEDIFFIARGDAGWGGSTLDRLSNVRIKAADALDYAQPGAHGEVEK